MDDDEDLEIIVKVLQPRRHDKWSVIVLAFSLVEGIFSEVASHAEAAVTALQEHRYYKIEESRFYEVVRDGHAG